MAFDLTDTTPFPSFTFGELDTIREGFTFDPEFNTDLNLDLSSLELPEKTKAKATLSAIDKTIYNPAPKSDPTSAVNDTNAILGDYLGGLKEKAGKQAFWGGTLKTAAVAGNLFTALLTYGTARSNINAQAQNTKLQAKVQMDALDNQVLYYKNEIMDRFNTLIARNTVLSAAKGLRVSAANILEQSKETAHDFTQDMRTLESNAELKKIVLRSEQRQADLTKKLQKNLLTANLIKGAADLGLMISTGGGTFQSWGDLWANAGFGSATESLNETVYGG